MTHAVNPARSPAYVPPPWTHRSAKTLQVFCRTTNLKALDLWVPGPLQRRGDGVFAIIFMELPDIAELGPQYRSRESGVAIPVSHEASGRIGSTWAVMFVDNDIAQVAGREIWGHPKKLADVRVDLAGDEVRGEVRHLSYRDSHQSLVYRAEVILDESHPELRTLAADFGARIQKRILPSPYADEPESEDIVRVIVSDAVVHSERTGSAVVDLCAGAEGFDDLKPVEVLGAHFRVADFVLRHGKPAIPDQVRPPDNSNSIQ